MNKRFQPVKFEHLLGSVLKPSRYINHEINSYQNIPSENKINFCLVFPDVYEVGFSHLGLKILYSILNNESDAVADRAYTPWPDFADKLEENNLPLFTLESRISVKDFDIVGFTLQSELTYTNVLFTLDCAKIPIHASDRSEEDPIVLGGGPTSTNPEPLSDFFDAFLIGDGEEAIIEIKNAMLEHKHSKRKRKLSALSKIPGVYVPALGSLHTIKARKYMKFGTDKGHFNQLLPWQEPTHYRFVSEIMRGCSRGCRFCHAGMFYRPVREKDPKFIVQSLLKEIDLYGWSEAALSSLSSSDYTCIKELLSTLFKELSKRKTSLSLPSLRVDSLDGQIIKLLNALRQSGLTIAPEAGSQRLRDIINKNISKDEILEGVRIALENGWQVIKLYFMIGLPFEEDSDIEGIITLIEEILEMSGKRLKINVTISPFVPKSFTPFQWSEMGTKEYLSAKASYLKNHFKQNRKVKISYHEIDSSQLECILGRGNRDTGKLIYHAYKLGAKFDGWKEFWDFSKWEQAISDIGYNWQQELGAISQEAELPWNHIDIGIDKSFLKKEWEKASKQEVTDDCRTGKCSGCGVCKGDIENHFQKQTKLNDQDFQIQKREIVHQQQWIFRIFYSKMGLLRFVSHLDLVRMIQNFLRASKLPLIYSQGYNIHPKLNFGPPLSIGVEGKTEYFDIYLSENLLITELEKILQNYFPKPLKLGKIIAIESKTMLSMDYYDLERIAVTPEHKFVNQISKGIEEYQSKDEWIFTRIRKGKERQQDLKAKIRKIQWDGEKLIIIKERVGASIFDFLNHVCGIERDHTNGFRIVREEIFRETS